jgi:polyisoprenoid-binding protein YceI
VALKPALLLALALCGACAKPEDKPRRTEPWLAQPSASGSASSAAPTRRFRFASDSSVRFSVPGKKGTVSGRFTRAQGSLELDPAEPKNTRANLEVDLTTLSIDTEAPPGLELGGSPATVGMQWLELGAEVPADRRQQFKTARFELTSLEGPNASELRARRRTGVTRVAAVGTLLLHGFRAPVRLELLVAGGGTERLSIRSASALVIPLSTHDITARGPTGIADVLGAARAGDWVGKNVRVELELFAEPEPALK